MNDKQRDIIYNCLYILYDLNHTINLLESIGIHIEGDISPNNIGSDIYSSISKAYSILETVAEEICGTSEYVSEAIENLYAYDSNTTVSRDNAINTTMILFRDMPHNVNKED